MKDLGSVTPATAISGVQATANVPATHSVTFQFSIQLGGEYRLLVRHTGNDLSLVAATPAGTATIDAGQEGSFHQILLDLAPGNYQITVSSTGSEPVFIDWELVLYNGVGQTASLAIAFGSASGGSANLGPLPGNPVTTPAPYIQAASPDQVTVDRGLFLTLESTLVGNPSAVGQSSAIAASIASLVTDVAPDGTPTLVSEALSESPTGRSSLPRLGAPALVNVRDNARKPANVELDEQSLHAVAWVNGLVRRIRFESLIGQTNAEEPIAKLVSNELIYADSDIDRPGDHYGQENNIDRPALASVLAVGMAVVAMKYGRSIPKRSRNVPSVLRILGARTPMRVDPVPHAHEPWYVRLSQWPAPRSICARFGCSTESARTDSWSEKSLF